MQFMIKLLKFGRFCNISGDIWPCNHCTNAETNSADPVKNSDSTAGFNVSYFL